MIGMWSASYGGFRVWLLKLEGRVEWRVCEHISTEELFDRDVECIIQWV